MTLLNHGKGHHECTQASSLKKCLLTPEQSKMLFQWVSHHAEMGMPYSIKDLQAEVARIVERNAFVRACLCLAACARVCLVLLHYIADYLLSSVLHIWQAYHTH